jgi:DUF917 family protein
LPSCGRTRRYTSGDDRDNPLHERGHRGEELVAYGGGPLGLACDTGTAAEGGLAGAPAPTAGRTISLAEELGQLIRQTQAPHGDPIAAILRRLGGYRLFDGKISDVERRTETGFAKGEAE